jgi:hypothetical protein
MIRFVALLLATALAVVGVVGVATAGEVVVEAVYAAQYGFYPLFIALVFAHGDLPLADVQLLVNDTTAIVEDRVQKYVLDPSKNAALFVIKQYGTNVVQSGDRLTALVHDNAGDPGELQVSCGSQVWGRHDIVVCKP